MREELFLVSESSKEKLTFMIVEGGKIDVFLVSLVTKTGHTRHVWLPN